MKLQEEYYSGSYITAYHRTPVADFIDSFLGKGGYSPGNGKLYGVGWYFTRDFESQSTDYMNRYGNTVIKAKVPLEDMVIFDRDLARQVYGEKHSIQDQVEKITGMDFKTSQYKVRRYFPTNTMDPIQPNLAYTSYITLKGIMKEIEAHPGLNLLLTYKNNTYEIMSMDVLEESSIVEFAVFANEDQLKSNDKAVKVMGNSKVTGVYKVLIRIPIENAHKEIVIKKKIITNSSNISSVPKNQTYTGTYAKEFYNYNHYHDWYKKIKGLVYTGEHDGRCVVSYSYHDVIPYKMLTGPTAQYVYTKNRYYDKYYELLNNALEFCLTQSIRQMVIFCDSFAIEMKKVQQQGFNNQTMFPQETLQQMTDEQLEIYRHMKSQHVDRLQAFLNLFFKAHAAQVIPKMSGFLFFLDENSRNADKLIQFMTQLKNERVIISSKPIQMEYQKFSDLTYFGHKLFGEEVIEIEHRDLPGEWQKLNKKTIKDLIRNFHRNRQLKYPEQT